MEENNFGWLGGIDEDPVNEMAQAQEEAIRRVSEERMEFARKVFDVFNAPGGLTVLSELRQRTIEKPLMVLSGSISEAEISISPAEWAFYREGQNSVIRWIELMMDVAQNPPEELQQQREQNDEQHDT